MMMTSWFQPNHGLIIPIRLLIAACRVILSDGYLPRVKISDDPFDETRIDELRTGCS